MERPTWATGGVVWICCVLVLGSCRCEERIREAVSRDNVQKHFDDTEGGSGLREQEPNDVPEQATLVELGETLRDVEGRVESRNDRDWFSLRTATDERRLITVHVVPTSEDFDPTVRVELEPSSSEQISYDNREEGEKEIVRNLALSGDVRRIGVRGRGGSTGRYTIEFERRLTAGAIEREPNDERKVATRFEFPGDIQGFYDRPGDVDWFHVLRQDVTPGIYRINVKPTGSFSQTLRLFTRREGEDPYLSLQVPEDRALDVPNVRIPEKMDGLWLRFSAGREYEAGAGYRLRIVEHPGTSDQTIEAEPNDAEEDSFGIDLGETVAGYLHSDRDLDRFHLAVGRPLPEETADVGTGEASRDTGTREDEESRDTGSREGPRSGGERDRVEPIPPIERVPKKEQPDHVVQVGLEPLSKKDRLTLIWWNEGSSSDGETFTTTEAGEPVKVCNYSTDRGLMQLGVRAEELEERSMRRSFTYELSTLDIADEVQGLEIEPNDRRDEADRLELGSARTGYISNPEDRDLFAFGVPFPESGAGLRASDPQEESKDESGGSGREEGATSNQGTPPSKSVRIRLRGNELNLGFEVLDSEGALVDEVDHGGAGVDESTSIDLPPGLYYVRVTSDGGAVCKPYRLRVVRGDQE